MKNKCFRQIKFSYGSVADKAYKESAPAGHPFTLETAQMTEYVDLSVRYVRTLLNPPRIFIIIHGKYLRCRLRFS